MHTSKYAKVQAGIVDLIAKRGISYGGILPTEKELSTEFDVSLITIRRALKNLQDDGIVSREQGRGTFVTADIKNSVNNGTITFLSIASAKRKAQFFAEEVTTLGGFLGDRGYKLNQMYVGESPEAGAIPSLRDAAGVIACGYINEEWLQWLKGLNKPVILMGDIMGSPLDIPMAVYDWKKMTSMVTKKMLEHGAKRLGLIVGGKKYAPTPKMVAGYKSVLVNAGIKYDEDLVFYMEGDIDNISKFIKANRDVDGFIVERGGYTFVLESMMSFRTKPLLGVMGTNPASYKLPPNVIKAGFPKDIQEVATELLFEAINSESNKGLNKKIEPVVSDFSK